MDLPDASQIILMEISPNAQTGLPEEAVVARGDGSGQVNGFSVVPTFEGRTVTFTLTGPFNTNHNYRVHTPTPFTGGKIVPGHNYVNQAYFAEADQSTNEYTRSYFESFKATISYRQGFGGFNIAKGSTGSAVPPAGQKFTVSVAYELPQGKTAADFPGWTNVPASNPTTMEVTVGATTAYPFEFSMGTKVTLTEDVASANPAATDLVWGAPKFSSDDQRVTIAEDGAKASFTIADREALPVTLTNTATGLGQFSVTKQIGGDDAAAYADQEFTFAYTCSDGTTGSLTTSQAKGAATIGEKLPAGTTCEVTEQAAGDRAGYTLTAPEAQNVTIKTGEVTALTFVNTYERDKGSFSITKQVAGDAADLAPQSFTFSYQCADMTEAKTVEAVAGQPVTVDGVATGSCTLSEAAAEVENTTSSLEFTVDGAAVAAKDRAISFDVAKGAEVKVQATNTYTANKGTFQVAKSVQGIDPQAAGSFEFTYACSDDSTGKLTVPGDGTAVKAETSHRVGVTCEVTEVAFSAEREGYTVETPQPATVTVAADSSKVAEFVNVYTAKPAPSPEPSPTPTPEQAPATPSPSPIPEQAPATPTAAPTSEQPSATPTPSTVTPSAPATTAPATSAPTTAEQSPVATPSPVKLTVKPGLPKTGK